MAATHHPIALGPKISFFLVHVADASGSHIGGRYVRQGALFDEPDPWVKVVGWPGRDPMVHRFETAESADRWKRARFSLKRTMCRVLATSGPMREGDKVGDFRAVVDTAHAPELATAKRSPRGRSRNTPRVTPKR